MTEQSLPKLDWQVVVNRKAPDGVRGWGRVRAAQLHEMGRAMEIAAWGQTFNALLICYLLAGRAPSPLIAAWLLGLALLMIYIVQNKRKLRGRQVFVTGERKTDLAVRLEADEVAFRIVASVDEAVAAARSPSMEVIANYTAFQQIRAVLGRTD